MYLVKHSTQPSSDEAFRRFYVDNFLLKIDFYWGETIAHLSFAVSCCERYPSEAENGHFSKPNNPIITLTSFSFFWGNRGEMN